MARVELKIILEDGTETVANILCDDRDIAEAEAAYRNSVSERFTGLPILTPEPDEETVPFARIVAQRWLIPMMRMIGSTADLLERLYQDQARRSRDFIDPDAPVRAEQVELEPEPEAENIELPAAFPVNPKAVGIGPSAPVEVIKS